jgi:hypothetical protein
MAAIRFSSRRLPLVCVDDNVEVPILTVENYCKWYDLQIVHPDGRVEAVPFPDDGQGTPYVDHVPNPHAVARYADRCGYHIDLQAFEMIVGRWQLEVVG